MKKTIKIILIIIFFICFLGLFLRPQTAKADFVESVYNVITTYKDFIASSDDALLSQFYTYGYLGIRQDYESGLVVEYSLNFTIDRIEQYPSSNQYVVYAGVHSYYTSITSDNLTYSDLSGAAFFVHYDNNGIIDMIYVFSNWYYVVPPGNVNPVRTLTYCDLPNGYYTNPHDGTSLVRHNLYSFPSSFPGVISSPSAGSTFGDNIQSAIDTVSPAPVVTTSPPFQSPATVPPIFSPVETVTAFPALTDDSNNYYIDYSPYIDGNFYVPPETDDISLSPALSASGAIISEGFGWLSDSGMFSVLLVLMLVSFAIYNLI